MFCRKFDLLMRLTGTSNTALGSAISIAPSYVSKLRSGSRVLPRNPAFLRPACDFLAKRLTSTDQTDTLTRLIANGQPFPTQPTDRAELLYLWLLDQITPSAPSTSLPSQPAEVYQEPNLDVMAELSASHPPRAMRLYFGITGRREAVLRLLSEVAAQNTPQTLLLYCDDSLEWLIGDESYARLWSERMLQLFDMGCNLVTIHSSHRSADEMYQALRAWLPLYVTGRTEIFYCPKVRDNLFFHNMFIAPDTAGITSFTTSPSKRDMINTYYTNPQALQSLKDDFYEFLHQCRPSLTSCTVSQRTYFWESLEQLSAIKVRSASLTPGLSSITLPLEVMLSIQDRTGIEIPPVYQHFEVGILTQLSYLEYFDIFALPDPSLVRAGRAPVPLSKMLSSSPIYYTLEELHMHLEYLIFLINTFDTYHPFLQKSNDQKYGIFVKEDVGVIISSSAPTEDGDLFLIRKDRLAEEYWNYIEARRNERDIIRDRATIVRMISEYLQVLDAQ